MTYPDPFASAAMVAYCGWDPTAVDVEVTAVLDGTSAAGSPLLTLPSLYVTDVSAVTISDSYGVTTDRTVAAQTFPSAGTATPADVSWSQNGCLLWNGWGCGWPDGVGNVQVTYTSGYPEPPEDLLAALASLAKRINGGLFGATSSRMGTGAVTFGQPFAAGGLLLVEQMVFDRYRLPRVA